MAIPINNPDIDTLWGSGSILNAQGFVKPTQASTVRMQDYWDTETISQTVQGEEIIHRFLVQGSPAEAELSAGLVGVSIGNAHPWKRDMFCAERTFRWLADSDVQDERITLVTFVYRKMPCPRRWSVVKSTALVTYNTWYSYDDPPISLTDQGAGIPIARALPVLTLRRMLVERVGAQGLDMLDRDVGKRNKEEILGQPAGFWLFEDLRVTQLWGDAQIAGTGDNGIISEIATYEVQVTLKGDPWRHHNWWPGLRKINNKPVRPTKPTIEQFEQAHLVVQLAPATADIKGLLEFKLDRSCGLPDEILAEPQA